MQGASIAHLMPGRVRLRFSAQRSDIPFFEDLVRTLSTHPLVNRRGRRIVPRQALAQGG